METPTAPCCSSLDCYSDKKKCALCLTVAAIVLLLVAALAFSAGKQLGLKQVPLCSPCPAVKSPINQAPETLKCVFTSGWFGFSFNYSVEKKYASDSCYSEGSDYELTDYTWPNGVFNLTFYLRNGMSGKEWWGKHISDEAGYLKEDKYIFEYSKTPRGVEKMTVSINNNKVNQKVDHVGAGPFRGSDYYFGGEWVIRNKAATAGGPCVSCDEFEKSIRLTPIKDE